jgi:hypothetical protein
MRNALLFSLLFVGTIACPRDNRDADTPLIPIDTTPVDLSQLETVIPPMDPDTFKAPPAQPRRTTPAAPAIAEAPAPLDEAVRREQSAAVFCYQQFGLRTDPSLRGNVAMVVTVTADGVSGARVANDNWTSRTAGNAVNQCLNERASAAWKLAPGAVRPGQYRVQLQFTGG